MGGEAGIRAFLQELLPWMLADLLDNGQIDESRLDDPVYLITTLRSNIEWFKDRPSIVQIGDEFVDAAREELERGRIGAAIILIATAIEHCLNSHFRFVLGRNGQLSEGQITSVIKNNNLPAKLDWLMALVTGLSLSEAMSTRVVRINEMRNSLVHYKFEPTNEGDSTQRERVYAQAKQFGFDKLLTTPTDLERELSAIEKDLFPNLDRAHRLVGEMFDGLSKLSEMKQQ